jgi:hypothetical protein
MLLFQLTEAPAVLNHAFVICVINYLGVCALSVYVFLGWGRKN